MSDWQVGDLAVCIESGYRSRKGCLYTVCAILPPNVIDPEDGRAVDELCLRFVELSPHPRGLWCGHERFRKIRPDELEACEPEFVTLLKRSKRKVNA